MCAFMVRTCERVIEQILLNCGRNEVSKQFAGVIKLIGVIHLEILLRLEDVFYFIGYPLTEYVVSPCVLWETIVAVVQNMNECRNWVVADKPSCCCDGNHCLTLTICWVGVGLSFP